MAAPVTRSLGFQPRIHEQVALRGHCLAARTEKRNPISGGVADMKFHLHTDQRGGGDCFDLDVGDTVGVSTNSFGLSPDDQNIGLHISDPAVMRKLADMFLEAAADAMAAQMKKAKAS